MAYADLTTEQKTSLQDWLSLFRASSGEFAKLNNHLDVVNIEYNGVQSAVLDTLDGSDIIPNLSGLAGAESMTKDQIVTIVSYMQAVLAYNTAAHRQNLARACGEINLLG